MSRVWFITGCSTGFGRMLAEKALSVGDSVVASARSLQSLFDLGREDESRILRMCVDVKDEAKIKAATDAAIEKFGKVDILVNNAGYGYFASQEEGEMNEVREMFETNVFGVMRVTQAIVPHMRARRAGTIVNLSSIAGRIATPRGGFYQASKWALEALSESLYLEESSFGLRMIIVEPGSFATDFDSRSARVATADSNPRSPFSEIRATWRANAGSHIFVHQQNPSEVIDAILDAVNSPVPFIRLPVGIDARAMIQRRREMRDVDYVEWVRRAVHGELDGKE